MAPADPPRAGIRTDGGSRTDEEPPSTAVPSDPDYDDLMDHLEVLHETVDDPHERRTVAEAITLVNRLPGSAAVRDRVSKYTSRDIAEGIVGAIIFALPLLVEDGVFVIAEWFMDAAIGPAPLYLTLNAVFITTIVAGLLYVTDVREITIRNPILGIIPRRLVGLLVSSFLVATGLMLMWGRLHTGDPSPVEALARVSVVWTAAALGASLGDILPGESKGQDINDVIGSLGDEPRHEG